MNKKIKITLLLIVFSRLSLLSQILSAGIISLEEFAACCGEKPKINFA